MTPVSHSIGAGEGPLLSWLVAHQDLALLLTTFGGMLLLMMLEQVWPRRSWQGVHANRWIGNWLLASLNFFVLLYLTLVLSGTVWVQSLAPQAGLLSGLHPAVTIVLLLVAVEAVNYILHRLFHAVPLLWRFHAVHHSDPWVDVTTSHRHHLFEVAVTSSILLPLIVVTGVPVTLLAAAILLRALIILVNHSNLALPERLDALLRPFVVTPDFHRVHHSSDKHFTDSNFGTVLPLFDYLCGTARRVPYDAQPGMRCGLHAWRDDADSRIDRLLLLPFRWRRPEAVDGSATQSGAAQTPVDHTTGLAAEK